MKTANILAIVKGLAETREKSGQTELASGAVAMAGMNLAATYAIGGIDAVLADGSGFVFFIGSVVALAARVAVKLFKMPK